MKTTVIYRKIKPSFLWVSIFTLLGLGNVVFGQNTNEDLIKCFMNQNGIVDVLQNDNYTSTQTICDVYSSNGSLLSYKGGAFSTNGAIVTYTPTNNFYGIDSAHYIVCGQDTELIVIAVMDTNLCGSFTYSAQAISPSFDLFSCDGVAQVNINGTSPFYSFWTHEAVQDFGMKTYSYTETNGSYQDTTLCAGGHYLTIVDSLGCYPYGTGGGGGGGPLIIDAVVCNGSLDSPVYDLPLDACDSSGSINPNIFLLFPSWSGPSYAWNWNNDTDPILDSIPSGSYMLFVDYILDPGVYCNDVFFYTLTDSSQFDSVWPGDALYDGIVDLLDIFPIGIAYNQSGPSRAVQGINWAPHAATNWQTQINGTCQDTKHADCDGNGIVNALDTAAIMANYSLTHNKTELGEDATFTDPILSIKSSIDTALVGTQVNLKVELGDATTIVDSVYGVALQIAFDPTLFVDSTAKISYSNSWVGDVSNVNDFIVLDTLLAASGIIDIGMVRTNQLTKSGFGEILSVDIFITDDLIGKQAIFETGLWNIQQAKVITYDMQEIPVNIQADSIVITDETLSIGELNQASFKIYPNPVKDELTISGFQVINEVNILDVTGRLVGQAFGNKIDMSTYPKGSYLVEIKSNEQKIYKQIIKE
ncbi:MAG: T9SS type A sorting domain-containing protein [Flavobacteriales bacterium]|nr:T9SS type A sorting domain-containing protein [Flavobacteriales bacterium]